MQKNGLFLLSGITVAAIVAAGWAVRQRASSASGPSTGGLVFAGLLERANDVAEISITDGKDTVTLRRSDSAWSIAERGNFPANLEQVKETIVGLARLEIEEPKTKKKEQYAALGVEDPAGDDTTSKRVILKDAGGETLAGAVLSELKYRGGSPSLNLRREGDDQVYLCAGKLSFEATPRSWMKTELLRLEGDRVQSVQIVHKDGEEVRIGRSPENHTQFTVENFPPDRELSSASVANSIGTALSYLSLEDVRPAAEVDFGVDPRAQTHFRCHDGLRIDIESARVEGKTWVRLSAGYEEPIGPAPSPEVAPAPEVAATTPAEGIPADEKPDEPALEVAESKSADESTAPDPEKIKMEAADLNQKFTGWAFEIPDYRADVLAKRMEDLLKKPAEAAEETEAPVELPPELQEILEGAGGAATEEGAGGG